MILKCNKLVNYHPLAFIDILRAFPPPKKNMGLFSVQNPWVCFLFKIHYNKTLFISLKNRYDKFLLM